MTSDTEYEDSEYEVPITREMSIVDSFWYTPEFYIMENFQYGVRAYSMGVPTTKPLRIINWSWESLGQHFIDSAPFKRAFWNLQWQNVWVWVVLGCVCQPIFLSFRTPTELWTATNTDIFTIQFG